MKIALKIVVLLVLLSQCSVFEADTSKKDKLSETHPYGILGTYALPPLLKNGRVDCGRLIAELKDINADVYHFLIKGKATNWDDLKEFLPLARDAKIKVWVCLLPPSESTPVGSLPFDQDYERWGVEIATLSKSEPNLVAWSIDDFNHNVKFYTPVYMKKIIDASHAINPKLGFLPCCYYTKTTSAFIKDYSQFFDGILFPYRAESVGANLQDATRVETEIAKLRELFNRPGFPIYIDIYATAHSSLGASTPEYVKDVLAAGRKSADGIYIYCHQDPIKNAEKYKIIKEGFSPSHKAKI